MSDEEYETGYGKPPKHTQFKKGQSGNPKGRPKGTKNYMTDLAEELGETILVKEGGKPKKITKQRAGIKSLVSKSMKGDVRAATVILKLQEHYQAETSVLAQEAELSPEEVEMLEAAKRKFKSK